MIYLKGKLAYHIYAEMKKDHLIRCFELSQNEFEHDCFRPGFAAFKNSHIHCSQQFETIGWKIGQLTLANQNSKHTQNVNRSIYIPIFHPMVLIYWLQWLCELLTTTNPDTIFNCFISLERCGRREFQSLEIAKECIRVCNSNMLTQVDIASHEYKKISIRSNVWITCCQAWHEAV